MFDLKLKGLLSCQVLQKCLRLPANTARSGEPRSILSAEMIQLIETMSAIHRLWLAPVELAMNLVVLCSYSILLTFCLLPVLIGTLRCSLILKYVLAKNLANMVHLKATL